MSGGSVLPGPGVSRTAGVTHLRDQGVSEPVAIALDELARSVVELTETVKGLTTTVKGTEQRSIETHEEVRSLRGELALYSQTADAARGIALRAETHADSAAERATEAAHDARESATAARSARLKVDTYPDPIEVQGKLTGILDEARTGRFAIPSERIRGVVKSEQDHAQLDSYKKTADLWRNIVILVIGTTGASLLTHLFEHWPK